MLRAGMANKSPRFMARALQRRASCCMQWIAEHEGHSRKSWRKDIASSTAVPAANARSCCHAQHSYGHACPAQAAGHTRIQATSIQLMPQTSCAVCGVVSTLTVCEQL